MDSPELQSENILLVGQNLVGVHTLHHPQKRMLTRLCSEESLGRFIALKLEYTTIPLALPQKKLPD